MERKKMSFKTRGDFRTQAAEWDASGRYSGFGAQWARGAYGQEASKGITWLAKVGASVWTASPNQRGGLSRRDQDKHGRLVVRTTCLPFCWPNTKPRTLVPCVILTASHELCLRYQKCCVDKKITIIFTYKIISALGYKWYPCQKTQGWKLK